MEPGQPQISFGSGSNLLGGGASDAIAQAMARRGQGGGATSQVTPGAPTFDPTTQPAVAPTGAAPSAPQPPTDQSMNAMGQVTSPSDDTLIIKALSQKLKDNSSVQKTQSNGTF